MSRATVKGKKRQLTETDFAAIKAVLAISALNDSQMGLAVNRSASTIGYIRRCDDYASYKAMIKAGKARFVAKHAKQRPIPVESPSIDYSLTEVYFGDINDKLDLILAKLDTPIMTKKGIRLF